MCHRVLQGVAVRCSALQCVAVRCSALQCSVVCCVGLLSGFKIEGSSFRQQTATDCNSLQQSATDCMTLQQTATDCIEMLKSQLYSHEVELCV